MPSLTPRNVLVQRDTNFDSSANSVLILKVSESKRMNSQGPTKSQSALFTNFQK